jgi:hypothetical protein
MELKTKLATLLGCLGLAAGAWAGQGQSGRGIEIRSTAHARTAALRSLPPTPSTWRPGTPPRVIPWRKPREAYKPGLNKGGGRPGGGGGGGGGAWTDPDLQAPTAPLFTTTLPFQGQEFTGAIPPDTNLSVGVNTEPGAGDQTQIVQLVNTSYAIYDSTGGTIAAGGDLGGTLFAPLPSSANCSPDNPTSTTDGGDPVVLFDTLDHRWIISQLAYNSNFTQNDFCLAISDTSDAAGTYEVFDIPMGSALPDYPKLAVWGDGIYFSANMFKLKVNPVTGAISSTFLGAQACRFPRPTTTPSSVTFTCTGSGNTSIYNILPADIDGPSGPPDGTSSDYYLQFVDNLNSTSGNELMLYQFQSGALVSLGTLPVGAFHEACGGGTCVPQLGTSQLLDSIGDRLMYRLSYRKYLDGTQKLAVNHSVQLNSKSNQTGIRWYQLCNTSPGSALPFSVCGEGTFNPGGANYRWMGSIAQDSAGDLGLGYSVSGNSIYPSVAVTGMEPGQGGMEFETMTYFGPNFQDTYSRWGDYSGMAVDPKDDCTFWYTNEYSTTTNLLGVWNIFWGTVIGSLHFPNCPNNNP